MSEHEQERRRFFRIDDQVALHVIPVSEEELAQHIANPTRQQDNAGLPGRFAVQRERFLPILRKIQAQSPSIAAYMKLMEDQLDIIAKALDRQDDTLPTLPDKAVNLSAQGIRFPHTQALPIGSAVELKIKLFPSTIRIQAHGHIVQCQPVNESEPNEYDVTVDFTHIDDDNRELLVKHINRRQFDALASKHDDDLD